jgi:hypothetical protein
VVSSIILFLLFFCNYLRRLIYLTQNPTLCSIYFEGEIFGGIYVSGDSNDTEILMQALGKCCFCKRTCSCDEKGQNSVPDLLSKIKGPWSVIYWQVTLSGKFLFELIKFVEYASFRASYFSSFPNIIFIGKFKDPVVW